MYSQVTVTVLVLAVIALGCVGLAIVFNGATDEDDYTL
jgi:hypothetical protein